MSIFTDDNHDPDRKFKKSEPNDIGLFAGDANDVRHMSNYPRTLMKNGASDLSIHLLRSH